MQVHSSRWPVKFQQQLEDVDEVQVERECAEHGELLLRFRVEILGVLLLDRLGIPCGQPDADEDADDGCDPYKRVIKTGETLSQCSILYRIPLVIGADFRWYEPSIPVLSSTLPVRSRPYGRDCASRWPVS